MERPRKLIDLDARPRSRWRLEPEALHLFEGHLYRWIKVGCVLCVAEDERQVERQTLGSEADATWICLTHGVLDRLRYRTRRDFMVELGDAMACGTCVRDTRLFIPRSVQGDERDALIRDLLEEVRDLERGDFDDCDDPVTAWHILEPSAG